jgi:hypothetical protein
MPSDPSIDGRGTHTAAGAGFMVSDEFVAGRPQAPSLYPTVPVFPAMHRVDPYAAPEIPSKTTAVPDSVSQVYTDDSLVPAVELTPSTSADSSKKCRGCGTGFRMLALVRPVSCICCGQSFCSDCSIPAKYNVFSDQACTKTQRICGSCDDHWQAGQAPCLRRYLNILASEAAPVDTSKERVPSRIVLALVSLADSLEHSAACAHRFYTTVKDLPKDSHDRPIAKNEAEMVQLRKLGQLGIEAMRVVDEHGGIPVLLKLVNSVLGMRIAPTSNITSLEADLEKGLSHFAAAQESCFDSTMFGAKLDEVFISSSIRFPTTDGVQTSSIFSNVAPRMKVVPSTSVHAAAETLDPSPRMKVPRALLNKVLENVPLSVVAAQLAVLRVVVSLTSLSSACKGLVKPGTAAAARWSPPCVLRSIASAGIMRAATSMMSEYIKFLHPTADVAPAALLPQHQKHSYGRDGAINPINLAPTAPPLSPSHGAASARTRSTSAAIPPANTHTLPYAPVSVLVVAFRMISSVLLLRHHKPLSQITDKTSPVSTVSSTSKSGFMEDGSTVSRESASPVNETPSTSGCWDQNSFFAGSPSVSMIGAMIGQPTDVDKSYAQLQHECLKCGIIPLVARILGALPSQRAHDPAADSSGLLQSLMLLTLNHTIPLPWLDDRTKLTPGARAFDATFLNSLRELMAYHSKHGALNFRTLDVLLSYCMNAGIPVHDKMSFSDHIGARAWVLLSQICDGIQALTLSTTALSSEFEAHTGGEKPAATETKSALSEGARAVLMEHMEAFLRPLVNVHEAEGHTARTRRQSLLCTMLARRPEDNRVGWQVIVCLKLMRVLITIPACLNAAVQWSSWPQLIQCMHGWTSQIQSAPVRLLQYHAETQSVVSYILDLLASALMGLNKQALAHTFTRPANLIAPKFICMLLHTNIIPYVRSLAQTTLRSTDSDDLSERIYLFQSTAIMATCLSKDIGVLIGQNGDNVAADFIVESGCIRHLVELLSTLLHPEQRAAISGSEKLGTLIAPLLDELSKTISLSCSQRPDARLAMMGPPPAPVETLLSLSYNHLSTLASCTQVQPEQVHIATAIATCFKDEACFRIVMQSSATSVFITRFVRAVSAALGQISSARQSLMIAQGYKVLTPLCTAFSAFLAIARTNSVPQLPLDDTTLHLMAAGAIELLQAEYKDDIIASGSEISRHAVVPQPLAKQHDLITEILRFLRCQCELGTPAAIQATESVMRAILQAAKLAIQREILPGFCPQPFCRVEWITTHKHIFEVIIELHVLECAESASVDPSQLVSLAECCEEVTASLVLLGMLTQEPSSHHRDSHASPPRSAAPHHSSSHGHAQHHMARDNTRSIDIVIAVCQQAHDLAMIVQLAGIVQNDLTFLSHDSYNIKLWSALGKISRHAAVAIEHVADLDVTPEQVVRVCQSYVAWEGLAVNGTIAEEFADTPTIDLLRCIQAFISRNAACARVVADTNKLASSLVWRCKRHSRIMPDQRTQEHTTRILALLHDMCKANSVLFWRSINNDKATEDLFDVLACFLEAECVAECASGSACPSCFAQLILKKSFDDPTVLVSILGAETARIRGVHLSMQLLQRGHLTIDFLRSVVTAWGQWMTNFACRCATHKAAMCDFTESLDAHAAAVDWHNCALSLPTRVAESVVDSLCSLIEEQYTQEDAVVICHLSTFLRAVLVGVPVETAKNLPHSLEGAVSRVCSMLAKLPAPLQDSTVKHNILAMQIRALRLSSDDMWLQEESSLSPLEAVARMLQPRKAVAEKPDEAERVLPDAIFRLALDNLSTQTVECMDCQAIDLNNAQKALAWALIQVPQAPKAMLETLQRLSSLHHLIQTKHAEASDSNNVAQQLFKQNTQIITKMLQSSRTVWGDAGVEGDDCRQLLADYCITNLKECMELCSDQLLRPQAIAVVRPAAEAPAPPRSKPLVRAVSRRTSASIDLLTCYNIEACFDSPGITPAGRATPVDVPSPLTSRSSLMSPVEQTYTPNGALGSTVMGATAANRMLACVSMVSQCWVAIAAEESADRDRLFDSLAGAFNALMSQLAKDDVWDSTLRPVLVMYCSWVMSQLIPDAVAFGEPYLAKCADGVMKMATQTARVKDVSSTASSDFLLLVSQSMAWKHLMTMALKA